MKKNPRSSLILWEFGFFFPFGFHGILTENLQGLCNSNNRMSDKSRSWDAAWREILDFCRYYGQIRHAAGLLFPPNGKAPCGVIEETCSERQKCSTFPPNPSCWIFSGYREHGLHSTLRFLFTAVHWSSVFHCLTEDSMLSRWYICTNFFFSSLISSKVNSRRNTAIRGFLTPSINSNFSSLSEYREGKFWEFLESKMGVKQREYIWH